MPHADERRPGGTTSRRSTGRLISGAVVLLVVGTCFWSLISIRDLRRPEGPDPLPGLVAGAPSDDTGRIQAPVGTPLHEDIFSVWDADSDGRQWFVLDRRQRRIHRVDQAAGRVSSFGGEGRGPGEFSASPEALAVHGDTIAVVSLLGHLTLFSKDGSHLQQRTIRYSPCPRSGVFDMESTPRGLLFLLYCPQGAKQEAIVTLETFEGTLRTLARSAPQPYRPGTLDPDFFPVLAADAQSFFFGSAGDDCLATHNLEGRFVDSVCHRWIERGPLAGAALDERLELEARMRGSGLRIRKTDEQLPFDRVFVAGDGTLRYLGPDSQPLNGWRLMTKGPNAELAVIPLPPASHVFVRRDEALLAWDDLEGTRISIVPLPTRNGN